MLTEKQVNEIREHLEKAQNPLFFFDNDVDGLSSFLILARYAGKGKGIAIKSFPALDSTYTRKLHELNPDYVFVLDKPIISQDFVDEVKKLNLPFVWLDHHDVSCPDNYIQWYNPMKNEKPSNEPTTFLAYQVSRKKEDLWLAVLGSVADNYLPDFIDEFGKENSDLWKEGVKTAFQILYETELGKTIRILSFALKDKTSNVIRMLKFLIKAKSPHDILKDDLKNHILFRFNQIDKKYQKILEKAKKFAGKGKLLFFQYGGDLSLSADIANELIYRYPSKVVVVAYLKGNKANLSLRGKNVKEITRKAIEGLDNATGGGHEQATGAQMSVEYLTIFKEKVEKLIDKE